jgi:hypothetical protein
MVINSYIVGFSNEEIKMRFLDLAQSKGIVYKDGLMYHDNIEDKLLEEED